MNLDKRSKIIIGLIVAALVVLIWQLYALFGNGFISSKSAPKVEASTSVKEAANPTDVLSRRNEETAATLAQNVKDTSAIGVSANQQKYLQLVSEYQMLEIQKMIAQDQAAIAQSRVATAESLAKIGQSGGANGGDLSVNSTDISSDFELIYTGEDNGEWTATLKKNGQFNDVTTGSVLPDGSKVLSVDDNGVLVQTGNLKRLVTFNGVTPFDSNAEEALSQKKMQAKMAPSMPAEKPAVKPVPEMKAQKVVEEKPSIPPKVEVPKKNEAPAPKVLAIVKPPVEKPVMPAAPKVVAPPLPKIVATNVASGFDITKADKNAYTIQIVADDSLETINAFIKENNLSGKAQAVKTLHGQKPWYIGIYGTYPTASEAQKAIDSLPDAVQDEDPFVKRVADIQSKMEKQK